MSVVYVNQFNADLGELSISSDKGKHWKRFLSRNIRKMKECSATQKRFLGTKKVKRVEVEINGDDNIYVFQQGMVQDDFQWIVTVLKKFCDKYKIEYEEEEEMAQ